MYANVIDKFVVLLVGKSTRRNEEGVCLCECGCESVGMCMYWKEPALLVNT